MVEIPVDRRNVVDVPQWLLRNWFRQGFLPQIEMPFDLVRFSILWPTAEVLLDRRVK